VILSGVTVNTGAVIGCNSVVTHNVPPFTIVAGNPAREIRKCFSEDHIAWLLSSRWWELDREQLTPLLTVLCSSDIGGFLDQVDKFARSPCE
jgi:carbonic anhydrase/acetyltransferase-like protein (isoleucine patch superfamily)